MGDEQTFALDEVPAALLTIDAADGYRLTPRACALLGERDGEGDTPASDGPSILELFAADEHDALRSVLTQARSGEVVHGTWRLADDAGRSPSPPLALTGEDADHGDDSVLRTALGEQVPLPRFVELALEAIGDGELVGSLVDVTERVRHEAVLGEVASNVWLMDALARMRWGPIGRDADRDATVLGSLADRIHPEDLAIATAAFVEVLETPGRREAFELRGNSRAADGIWMTSRYELVNCLHDPRIGALLVSGHQTEPSVEVPSLARTNTAHLSVAEAAPVGIILTGPRGLPVYFNGAAMKLLPGTGVSDRTLERDWTSMAIADHRPKLLAMIEGTLTNSEQRSMLARFEPAGGTAKWLLVTACPRVSEDDRLVGLVTTLQDVTSEIEAKEELEEAQLQLIQLVRHDALTGLATRAVLEEELTARLKSGEHDVAVLFCDLDGFKAVNDEHGHAIGDELLSISAWRLQEIVHASDASAVVARVGGDEFVALVEAAEDDALRAMADRLVAELSQRVTMERASVMIGLSIGYTTARPDDDSHSILRRADAAMYDAKASGRGRAHRAPDD